ncbi:hypothetical protein ACA910_019211 [Epithemia clementina (nom. ined.)]
MTERWSGTNYAVLATTTTTTAEEWEEATTVFETSWATRILERDLTDTTSSNDDDDDNKFPASWAVVDALIAIVGIVTFFIGVFFIASIAIFARANHNNSNTKYNRSSSRKSNASKIVTRSTTATTSTTSTTVTASMLSTDNASSTNFPIPTDSGCETIVSTSPPPPSLQQQQRPTISSWNLYLIFLLIPDVLNNGSFGMSTLVESITRGESNQRGMCNARILLSYMYLPANLYANAVVAREMYRLAYYSYRRQRVQPPKLRTVILQMVAVYAWSLALTLWNIANVSWSPTHYDPTNDFCIRATGSPTSSSSSSANNDSSPTISPTLGSLINLTINLIPICYVFYAGFRIWRGHLLPIKGRTRALAMYFFRVVLVFGIFFVPMLLLWAALQSVGGDDDDDGGDNAEESSSGPTLVEFILYCLIRIIAPLQLLVTLRLAMVKDDVADAVRDGFMVLSFYCGSGCCSSNNLPEELPPPLDGDTTTNNNNTNNLMTTTAIPPPSKRRRSSFFPRRTTLPPGGGDNHAGSNHHVDEVTEWDADDVYDNDDDLEEDDEEVDRIDVEGERIVATDNNSNNTVAAATNHSSTVFLPQIPEESRRMEVLESQPPEPPPEHPPQKQSPQPEQPPGEAPGNEDNHDPTK